MISNEIRKITDKTFLFILSACLILNIAITVYVCGSGSCRTIEADDDYITGYRDDVERLLFAARVHESELPAGTYMRGYELDVIRIYEDRLADDIERDVVAGWDTVFRMRGTCTLLSVVIVVVAAVRCAGIEDECKMTPLYTSCIRGRRKMYACKAAATALTSAAVCVLFFASEAATVAVAVDLRGAGVDIRILPQYELCPYALTVGGYFAARLAVTVLFTCVTGLFASLITRLTRSQLAAAAAVLFVFIIGYALASTDAPWNGSYAKNLNLYSALFTDKPFLQYVSLNVFGASCGSMTVTTAAAFLSCAVMTSLLALLPVRGAVRTVGRERAAVKRAPSLPRPVSMTRAEIMKISGGRFTAAVCVMLVAAKVIFDASVCGEQSDDDSAYHECLMHYIGEYTEEKSAAIKARALELEETVSRRQSVVDMYKNGEIDDAAYRDFMNSYWLAYAEADDFARVSEYGEYLRTEAPDASFVYDTGYNCLFTDNADLFLTAFVFCLCGIIFLCDRDMYAIIRTTAGGRMRLFRAKITLAFAVGFLSALVFTALDVILINKYFPLGMMSAPASSIRALGKIGTHIDIGEFMCVYALFKSVVFAMFSVLSSLLCMRLGNFVLTGGIAAALIALPVMAGPALPIVEYVSLPSALSVVGLLKCSADIGAFYGFGYFIAYIAAFAALAVCASTLTYRRFFSEKSKKSKGRVTE